MIDTVFRNVEAIIFDIDGTLYDINDVISDVYDSQVDFVYEKTNIQRVEIVRMFNENNIFPFKSENSKSATEFFGKIGLDLKEWSNYKNNHFNVERIDIQKAINPSIIPILGQKYKLFAVTSNTSVNAYQVLRRLKIESSLFQELVTSDIYQSKEPFQKKKVILSLIEKYSISCRSILSIGDRYDTDISPVLEIGGKGVLVYDPRGLEQLFRSKIQEEIDNTLFKFYDYI